MTAGARRVGLVAGDDTFSRSVTGALTTGLTAAGWEATIRLWEPELDHERLLMDSDVTVVVLDRYARKVVERMDVAAHGTLRPWLSVTVQHPFVHIGPYVSPFQGACHECLRIRLAQHGRLDPTAERSASTSDGPARGIAPHVAVTAAAVALAMLQDGEPADRRDAMVLLHCNGLPMSRAPVVGVHRCSRCGDRLGRRPPARDNDRIRAVLPVVREPR